MTQTNEIRPIKAARGRVAPRINKADDHMRKVFAALAPLALFARPEARAPRPSRALSPPRHGRLLLHRDIEEKNGGNGNGLVAPFFWYLDRIFGVLCGI